jgi:hypothetical protein
MMSLLTIPAFADWASRCGHPEDQAELLASLDEQLSEPEGWRDLTSDEEQMLFWELSRTRPRELREFALEYFASLSEERREQIEGEHALLCELFELRREFARLGLPQPL